MSEEEKKPDHVARVWRLVEAIVPWGAFALAVAGVGFFIVLTGWVLVDFFNVLDNPPENKDGVNDRAAVRNVGLVLAALVAGGFAVWRAEIARRATAAAEAQVKRQQDRDYADLFTKAVEQLGTTREIRSKDDDGNDIYTYKPNIEVRLGAIYALERISQDSERDHIAVMETLCAYVRENAPAEGCEAFPVTLLSQHKNDPLRETMNWEKASEWWLGAFTQSFKEWIGVQKPPRADIQAVLNVIGRRKRERIQIEMHTKDARASYQINLKNTNLRRADLRQASLQNAILAGARLEGAHLGDANLSSASLAKANLQTALIWGADLNNTQLARTHFESTSFYKVDLSNANLSGAHLEATTFQETNLINSNMFNASMESSYGLDAEDVDNLFGSSGTTLPYHYEEPKPIHWFPGDSHTYSFTAYHFWKTARAAGEKPDWVDAADWSGWDGAA